MNIFISWSNKKVNDFINWLIPPVLISDIRNKKDERDVLVIYIRLIFRFIKPMTIIAILFMAITAIDGYQPHWLALDMKLDGSTVANYVALVFGTVVALAGSLVAIVLALRSEATSAATQKLEEKAEDREAAQYARQITVELSTFYRSIEKSIRAGNADFDLFEIELFFAARYLVRTREWSKDQFNSPPELEQSGDKNELHSLFEVLHEALKCSSGWAKGVTGEEIFEDPLLHDRIERVVSILTLKQSEPQNFKQVASVKPDFIDHKTPLELYVNFAKMTEQLARIKKSYRDTITHLGAAFDLLEKNGCISDLIAKDEFSHIAFFDARAHIEALSALELSDEEFLTRYCLARLLYKNMKIKESPLGFLIVLLSLPTNTGLSLYSITGDLFFTSNLYNSLLALKINGKGLTEFFNFSATEIHDAETANGVANVSKFFKNHKTPPIYETTIKELNAILEILTSYFKRNESTFNDVGTNIRTDGAHRLWCKISREALFKENAPNWTFMLKDNN
jgi:hypothetical protein